MRQRVRFLASEKMQLYLTPEMRRIPDSSSFPEEMATDKNKYQLGVCKASGQDGFTGSLQKKPSKRKDASAQQTFGRAAICYVLHHQEMHTYQIYQLLFLSHRHETLFVNDFWSVLYIISLNLNNIINFF